jgi:hypothetical protein
MVDTCEKTYFFLGKGSRVSPLSMAQWLRAAPVGTYGNADVWMHPVAAVAAIGP